MFSSAAAARLVSRRPLGRWAVVALVVALLLGVAGFGAAKPTVAEAAASQVTSSNGAFTLTKTPSSPTVPYGGGSVTYTYTVKNNTSANLWYVSSSDDKCGAPTPQSGLTDYFDWVVLKTFSAIAPGGTATFTCSETITQNTTNNATFSFATGYNQGLWSYQYTGQSSATASATVTIAPLNGKTYDCSTIWYSSDAYDGNSRVPGTLGTVNTSTGQATSLADITTQVNGGSTPYGAAAVAIDPAHPNLVYYVDRTGADVEGTKLWVYDTTTSTSKLVTSWSPGKYVDVRLGFSPNGLLYSLSSNGVLFSMNPTATPPTWDSGKQITLSGGPSLSWSNVGSGDLVFDGNGTMYFIVSDVTVSSTPKAYLYSITAASLASSNPTATYVGPMGNYGFNGIAFGTDGTLYGSSNTTGTYQFYKIDITTGSVTPVGSGMGGPLVADLASCALPKPQLTVSKTVSPSGAVAPGGTLSYTITVQNLGTLAATGVMFQDPPTGSTPTSETLNGGASLGATYFNAAKPINSPGANAGIIAPGGTATIVINTTVPSSSTALQVCNQASVNLTGVTATLQSDDPTLSGSADATCQPVIQTKLAVQKTGSVSTLNADGSPTPVTYTYTVTNQGTEPIKNVTVSDDKCKTGMTYASGDTNSDGVLQTNETWTYTCTQTLTQATTNTVTVTGTGVQTGNPTPPATATYTVTNPAMKVTKTDDTNGKPVAPGQTITYTMTVTNTGNTTQNHVSLSDQLPSNLTYVAGSATKSYPTANGTSTSSQTFTNTTVVNIDSTTPTNETITIPASSFPAGATATGYSVTMNGSANATNPSTYTNCGGKRDVGVTAAFSGAVTMAQTTWVTPGTTAGTGNFSQDPTNANTSCSGAWNTVTKSGAISGSLTTSDTVLTLGWWDQWPNANITPDNQTSSVAVTITYTVPTYTTTTNAASAPANMVTSADNITLQPGQTMTVTLKAVVGSGATGSLTNQASVTSDTIPTPLTASVTDTVLSPQFAVQKSVTGGQPGGTGTAVQVQADGTVKATYTITVTNTGQIAAPAPAVTDTVSVPSGFTVQSVSLNGASQTLTNNAFTIPAGTSNLTTAAPGNTVSYTVVVTANLSSTASAVDWTKAGTCNTTNGGDATAGGMFNVAAMTGDSDGVNNNDACAPITQPQTTVQIAKLGANCDVNQPTCPLTGSTFQIYNVDPSTAGATPISSGQANGGAGKNVFTSSALTYPGTYWLVESDAPNGYAPLAQPVKFTLDSNGATVAAGGSTYITTSGTPAGASTTISVIDATQAKLPSSGGLGSMPFALAGLLLLSLAGLYHLMTSRLNVARKASR